MCRTGLASSAFLAFLTVTSGCWLFSDPTRLTRDAGSDADAGTTQNEASVPGWSSPNVTVVASDQLRPHWLVLDADFLYWMNEGAESDGGMSSQAMRLDRRDSTLGSRAVATGIVNAVDLAQDTQSLFWVEGPGECQESNGVGSISKSGGTPRKAGFSCYKPLGVRVDATDLYVVLADGVVGRSPKAAPGLVKLTPPDPSVSALALSNEHIYVASAASKSILQVDKSNPTSQRLFAAGQESPRAIETDGTHVYWVSSPAGTVARLAHDAAGAKPEVLATEQAAPTAIALDATAAYFVSSGTGTVSRVDKKGGPVQVLAQAKEPCGVAADDDAVYFSDCKTGTITRITR
jgi:hypothetical protein